MSVVTFAAGLTYLNARDIQSEPTMPFFVAVLEVPGLLVGVLLARLGTNRSANLSHAVREAFAGRSVVLLLGGLAIGALLGPDGVAPVKPRNRLSLPTKRTGMRMAHFASNPITKSQFDVCG